MADTRLGAPDRTPIDITATPCRHGPPLSRPIVGDVIGFALRWDGQEDGVLWVSGDTVWKHFRQGQRDIEREWAAAPEDVRGRIRWLPIGVGVDLAA